MNFQLENGQLFCWQWDLNQKVLIEGLGADWENMRMMIGNSKSKEGLYRLKISNVEGVFIGVIPDEVLQQDGYADVYIYDEESDTTIWTWRFTIKRKAKPMDYIYEVTETLAISNTELLMSMFEVGMVNPIAETDDTLYVEDNNAIYVI